MATEFLRRLQAGLTSVRKRQHSDYSQAIKNGDLDLVFETLAIQGRLPHRTLPTIANKTNVPLDTLLKWRHKLQSDPAWRPDPHRTGVHLRLPPEAEERIADHIQTEYIDRGRYCPPKMLDRLAAVEAASLSMGDVDEAVDEEGKPEFAGSWCWREGFYKRNGLAPRRFHAKKRSPPDDDIVSGFLQDWEYAKLRYTRDRIVNADETSWKVLHNGTLTITKRGADDVSCDFPCSEKACITVMAAIRRDGEKLPLWVIAKGLSVRSLKKFQEDDRIAREVGRGKLHLTFSKNGWVDQGVAIKYLKWLSKVARKEGQYLIWDVYPSHRSAAVKEAAKQANIELSFVPSGQTATWQPLDYRVFGSLKSRARERFDAAVATALSRGEQREWGMNDALVMLSEVWSAMGQEEISRAWTRLE